jgi:molecular chaperone Hsp33
MGRAVTAGLTLATLTKDEEQVTLQILGNGPLGSITVDARSSGRVRAYLKHPSVVFSVGQSDTARVSLAEAVGNQGIVNVIRDLGMAQNYSGQTALQTGEIDSDVENYLSTSEQIDSVLRCDTLVDGEGEIIASAIGADPAPGRGCRHGRVHSSDVGRPTIESGAARSGGHD